MRGKGNRRNQKERAEEENEIGTEKVAEIVKGGGVG
jgi:hypothetical protein